MSYNAQTVSNNISRSQSCTLGGSQKTVAALGLLLPTLEPSRLAMEL